MCLTRRGTRELVMQVVHILTGKQMLTNFKTENQVQNPSDNVVTLVQFEWTSG